MTTREENVEDFLSHYGVKGMKWGQRKQRRVDRAQGRIDRTLRIAEGTASLKDRALGSALTAKGAQRQLQRHANAQAKYMEKVKAGKHQVNEKILDKFGMVKIQDLDFHVKGDAKAGLDTGQKVAVGILAAYGALTVGKALASR